MTQTTRSPNRTDEKLTKDDLSEGTILRDEVYNERVEVVGVYVGQVYLRYPHHESKQLYRHECGADVVGFDELERHAADCDDGNPEWWETTDLNRQAEMLENGDKPYERVDRDGRHAESCSYDWPLDGHRFTIIAW